MYQADQEKITVFQSKLRKNDQKAPQAPKNAKKGAAGAEKCKNGAPQAPKKWKNDHQKIENFGPRKQGVALINPPPFGN